MAIGPCPRCGLTDTLYRCSACGAVRCHSATTRGSQKGCGAQGVGGNHGGICKVCKKGKYAPL
jgi:hypothetical protein